MAVDTSILNAVIPAAAGVAGAATGLLGNLYVVSAGTRRKQMEYQIER